MVGAMALLATVANEDFFSAWIPNTDLTPLDPAEVKDFSEKGKTKSLIGAYHVAAEAHPLSYFKDMLLDHQKAMQEDQELREQREAAKAAKAGKKKRKSDAADDDVDMEDANAGEEVETKKSSKKRKKDIESEGDEEKVGGLPSWLPVANEACSPPSLQRLRRLRKN
jgi:hypothetical protein